MPDMKSISVSKRSKFRLLHIEAPGCIVNIHFGLTDRDGREVTNISISADQYAGEPKWQAIADTRDTSDPGKGIGVRVVRDLTT